MPGEPVLRDMILSPDQRHLYLLSQRQVVRLPVENCAQYSSCAECLGSRDPHCGWCVLHNRCCRESECPRATELHRFTATLSQCVRLIVEPNNVSVTDPSIVLQLTVHNVPDLTAGVICSFESLGESEGQLQTDGGIRCLSPTLRDEPPGEHGDVRTVRLQLLSIETGVEFASTNFVFYDCSLLRTCLSCVSSRYPCHWCKYRHACTHNVAKCYFVEGRVNSTEVKSGSRARGLIILQGCPELLLGGEILIPVGVLQPITLRAKNLPQPQSGQKNYECVLGIQGRQQRVPAVRFNSSSVQCQNTSYKTVLGADVQCAPTVFGCIECRPPGHRTNRGAPGRPEVLPQPTTPCRQALGRLATVVAETLWPHSVVAGREVLGRPSPHDRRPGFSSLNHPANAVLGQTRKWSLSRL
ncbi:UNVERIFIED_CONTAM: Plexin-A3 [Gekko kuhli]